MMVSLEAGGKHRLPAKAREICVRHLFSSKAVICLESNQLACHLMTAQEIGRQHLLNGDSVAYVREIVALSLNFFVSCRHPLFFNNFFEFDLGQVFSPKAQLKAQMEFVPGTACHP